MQKKNSLKLLSLFPLIIISFLSACKESPTESEFKYPPDNEYKVSISQGVWGNVWFWEGDFMPVIDPKDAKITPVIRNIYIYEATSDSMVESSSGTFFTRINSNLITTIHSDIDGFFQVTLAPGKYSFFVKEDSLFYANSWDGEGHIQSATVTENAITKRQIDINYNAVY